MKVLNLLNIRIDGGTQARLKLNQDAVKDYAEHMREGAVFPPLVVYHDGSEYWLVDGFHRFFALRANGTASAECDVRTGTLREAILFSKGANGKRGLPATADDNRMSIIWMLNDEEYKTWTNTAIAKWIGVSSMTVGRIKSSMETKSDDQPVKTVVDKDGNQKQLDTSKITGRPKVTKPDVTTEDPTVPLKETIHELTEVVNSLSDENTVLRDKIAIGQWDASEIEKIDAEETLADLREQIRILEIDNKTLRHDRDMYQNRNAELMKTVKSLQTKLKKIEK